MLISDTEAFYLILIAKQSILTVYFNPNTNQNPLFSIQGRTQLKNEFPWNGESSVF